MALTTGDELARLAGRKDGLEVTRTLTRGALPEDRPLAYVCGRTPMVELVATLLVSLNHAPERIGTERFGPTGGVNDGARLRG